VKVGAKTEPAFRMPPAGEIDVDARGLAVALHSAIEGEVRFGAGTRALYTTGGSNYRQVPIGVVIPRTIDDVVETVALCREYDAPVLPHGAGTSLAGQSCNVAVVVDFSKYLNEVIEIDATRKLARVQPGCILDHLRETAEKQHQLTFGPDPSTHDHCTFGGMIGNNSCGVRSVMAQFYGPGPRMSDNVHELEVLLYDGRRLRVREGTSGHEEIDARLRDLAARYAPLIRERYPNIPRRVSGYNLDDLLPERFNPARALVGTEGTCVTVLEATVHLLHSPPHRALLVLGFDDKYRAADHVLDVLAFEPLGLEGVDETLAQDMRLVGLHDENLSLLPEGRGWLLAEFGGETKQEADDRAREAMAALKRATSGMKLYDDKESERHVWDVREAGLGATAFIPGKPDTYEGWEDSAVPPERLGEYLRRLDELAKRYEYESALYGHYGQGCVHARWNFDLVTRDGIRTFRRWLDDASDLVLELGGSISGEHGDGQSKAELLPKMFGPELIEGMREFKAIWDPGWKMNPGKVVDAYRSTDNLRLGTDYNPPHVDAHFAYPDDGGSFAHATTRCVGIGNCRRTKPNGQVMCPSFMVTREEKHTTRGRARILWEMLNGEELELWRSEEVFDALDLCLSCKGCTKDCPVHVDMPTLKAEFLAHHYEGRLRPRHAYAFGLIDQFARVASKQPALVNAFMRTRLAKLALGVHPRRKLPPFAPLPLRDWFHGREKRPSTGTKVILWADTFNNYFHTEVGVAAVEALEDAGYDVVVPRAHLCCGRPLYDYGMLKLARRYLLRVLDALRDDIRRGTPVVGIEPSCVAVFKDELVKLLPEDEDAQRLSKQTFHFAEFLEREGYEPPALAREAVLHGHCHEKATDGFEPAKKLLERIGLKLRTPDSGCCGMAGAWGYERAHYDVSLACGERELLPAVRERGEALVVTDGFSCKTQIEQGAHAHALHLAEVIRLAAGAGEAAQPQPTRTRRLARAAALAGGAVALAGFALALRRY
jgi:FAD/FMN-containing dehydrogenase/Fe-S oxidoreductase